VTTPAANTPARVSLSGKLGKRLDDSATEKTMIWKTSRRLPHSSPARLPALSLFASLAIAVYAPALAAQDDDFSATLEKKRAELLEELTPEQREAYEEAEMRDDVRKAGRERAARERDRERERSGDADARRDRRGDDARERGEDRRSADDGDELRGMSDAQRERFENATPEERQRYLESRERRRDRLFESMTPEQREQYRNASPEEQAAMRARLRPQRGQGQSRHGAGGRPEGWEDMTEEERRAYREQHRSGQSHQRGGRERPQGWEDMSEEERRAYREQLRSQQY
jgi:hypothetical protein